MQSKLATTKGVCRMLFACILCVLIMYRSKYIQKLEAYHNLGTNIRRELLSLLTPQILNLHMSSFYNGQ